MFSLATDAAPGRPNEDFVVATPDLAIVVDGAGVPMGGCQHGVAWYAQQLGARTLIALAGRPDVPLRDGLHEALAAVAESHADTCDLTDPGTPCAAVGILRVGDHTVETLALSDVTVVVETKEGPQVTCDLRIEEIAGTEPDAVSGLTFDTPEHRSALASLVRTQTETRNRNDGWWVAAAEPEAACHAIVDTYSRAAVRRLAIFSDGATRPVDQMGVYAWPEYLDLLDKVGPASLIAHVREIEEADPDGARYPRTKRHDDATLANWCERFVSSD
ncbi:integrase [Kribbella sindirgiensis]|uniref:Integrase n=1 Tax=Kribbella sindirgiensis TaxID=1124744 RepID=A0A4R0J1T9_9ACTN|nr:integrase [Kribbella sindirgiensis]TCC35105.1 integrase [Kribbella sindirgiensis]